MRAPVLEAQDIYRSFSVNRGLFKERRTLHAVSGVSLRLEKGEVLGLVGESGCGKSTLAKTLIGILPPTSGSIMLNGSAIAGLGRREVTRFVQPIFQDPYSSLNPRKTVGSIIGLPLEVHRIGDPAARRSRVEAIMERVGLPGRLYGRYPSQLSGGQRQRVAIARALVMEPEVVICDEPTSALDVSVQSQILNLLLDLKRDLDLTYILISHNLAVVEYLATRVAVMYLGRIVEEAPAETLFRDPRHPYTQALLASVLRPEPGRGVPDAHLGTTFPNPLQRPEGCSFHPRCPQALAVCRLTPPPIRRLPSGFVECHLGEG